MLVKWLSDETIFGGWEESVRFRTRTSKNTITTTRAKITRYAISETSYFEEPSRIHALIGNATYYYVTQHCRSLSILKTFPVKTLSVKIYVDLYRKFIQALHEAYLERQFETWTSDIGWCEGGRRGDGPLGQQGVVIESLGLKMLLNVISSFTLLNRMNLCIRNLKNCLILHLGRNTRKSQSKQLRKTKVSELYSSDYK